MYSTPLACCLHVCGYILLNNGKAYLHWQLTQCSRSMQWLIRKFHHEKKVQKCVFFEASLKSKSCSLIQFESSINHSVVQYTITDVKYKNELPPADKPRTHSPHP